MQVSIVDHGAKPGTQAVQTAAIQAAIDECHDAGGGTVVCPAGVWRTGSIWLKSHVTLHLESGCRLLASDQRHDYNAEPAHDESAAFGFENVSDCHLILAYNATHIAITGDGTIDGNGSAFLPLDFKTKWQRNFDWRPGQMIYLARCGHVRLRDVSMLNASYWTCFLHGCTDVSIRGLTIDNHDATPNGDGIDIDCCRNVTISDCRIASGDDCITLRANERPLHDPMACENVSVSNCVLHSPCNAIRVGVGNGVIQRCTFSNIVIHDSEIGINVVSHYSPKLPGSGATIRDVRFSQFVIDAQKPLHVTTGEQGTAPVTDIAFTDMRMVARRASHISGTGDNPIRNLTLSDIAISIDGGAANQPLQQGQRDSPVEGMPHAPLPVALHVADTQGMRCHDIQIEWRDLEGIWQYAMAFVRCERIEMTDVHAAQPPGSDELPRGVVTQHQCRDIGV